MSTANVKQSNMSMDTNARHSDARHGSTVRHLIDHYPEYLIEAWALGTFMVSACLFTVLLEHPDSYLTRHIANADLRRLLIGIAMGCTAIALIYSPWGKRSGAHMNPAVTLTFLRLGKIARIDAAFYVVAQCVGGLGGVMLSALIMRQQIADPSVAYAITVPGTLGVSGAFIGEIVIAVLMMSMILNVSNSARFSGATGLWAGVLVATFITFEAPLSGMSMNPARTLASAIPANVWTGFWIYLIAPVGGMQLAAAIHTAWRGREHVACAKLLHTTDQRCIHCGFDPTAALITPPLSMAAIDE
jgi:aquaporin Z